LLELLEAYGFFGLQQGSAVLLGVVRAKILAALLGPYGVGVFSQANQFFSLLQSFFGLGLSGSLTKLIAEYRSNEDFKRLNQTIVSVITLYGLLGIALILIFSLAAKPITQFTFNDLRYQPYILIVSISALAWVESFAILLIFRGLLHWKESSFVAIVGNATNIVIVAGCVFLWGITGAVISLMLSQLVNLIFGLYFLLKLIAPRHQIRFWQFAPSKEILQRLFHFAAPIMILNIFADLGFLFIRSQIVHQYGADNNGLYQAIISVSSAYLGFLTTSVWSYGIPKISSLTQNRAEAINIQNNGLRVSLLALAPFSIALLAGREVWIPILYSRAFLSIAPLFIWQVMGDIILVTRQNILITLIPFEKIRNYFIEGILYWAGWTISAVVGIPKWGILSPLVTYFGINVIMLIGDIFYQSRASGFRLSKSNRMMMFKGFPLLILGYAAAQFIPSILLRIAICSVIILIMLLWIPSRSEIQKAIAYLLSLWNKYIRKEIRP